LGDWLVVGVNSDETVRTEKGTAPVMTEEERITAVKACRFVDQVVTDVPYVMNSEYLKMITKKYQVDIIVHGDDECFDANGNDVYGEVKAQGRFRTVKRTEGVSTTELVGRMLLMTKDHHKMSSEKTNDGTADENTKEHYKQTRVSRFLPTTRRLSQFSGGKAPKHGDRIVYIDGSFDLFHSGHTEILRLAHQEGDFLLVGICDDETINNHRGGNWPIMNLHERVLCVLSCRYVDEVIIGAPWSINEDMIKTMNISVLVHGTSHDYISEEDPYKLPKSLGIYKEIQSPSTLTAQEIVDRIIKQRSDYQSRFEKKAKKEEQYLEQKKYVPEI